jgi:hypothetical protein
VSPNSIHIVQRIRQLLDQQIRTTMSALRARSRSGSPDWRSYHQRETEIQSLLDELENGDAALTIPENPVQAYGR